MKTKISHVRYGRYLFVKPLVTYKTYSYISLPVMPSYLMFDDKPFDYIKLLSSYISN